MTEVEKREEARQRKLAQLEAERKEVEGGETELYGEPSTETAPEPVEQPAASDPMALTEDELALIRRKAREKVEKEIRAAEEKARLVLIEKELDAEVLRQRREAGLTDHRDDIIEFLVNVGPFADRIVIDGTVYQHGHWYKMPRRVYDSMRDIMARSWESEDRAGNPNKAFAQERAMIGGINPMMMERRTEDGSFTVGPSWSVNGRTGSTFGVRGN